MTTEAPPTAAPSTVFGRILNSLDKSSAAGPKPRSGGSSETIEHPVKVPEVVTVHCIFALPDLFSRWARSGKYRAMSSASGRRIQSGFEITEARGGGGGA